MVKNKQIKIFSIILLVLITFSTTFISINNVKAGGFANVKGGSTTGKSGSKHSASNTPGRSGCSGGFETYAFPNNKKTYVNSQFCPRLRISLVYYYKKNGTWKEKTIGNEVWDHQAKAQGLITNDWIYTEGKKEFNFQLGSNPEQFITDTIGSQDNPDYDKFKRWLDFLKVDPDELNPDPSELCETTEKKPNNCFHKNGYRLKAELWYYVSTTKNHHHYKWVRAKHYIATTKYPRSTNHFKNGLGYVLSVRLNSNDVKFKCGPSGTINKNGTCPNTPYYDNNKTIGQSPNNKKVFNCTKTENCGYGLWLADVTKALEQNHEANCEYVSYNTQNKKLYCKLVDKEGNLLKNNILCSNPKYKEGKTFKKGSKEYKITKDCPVKKRKTNVTCSQVVDSYGKCILKEESTVSKIENEKEEALGKQILNSEPVDCNKYSTANAKYQETTVSPPCPPAPKYKYPIDEDCINCEEESTDNSTSFKIEDTEDWTAIVHSTLRTDNNLLQNYYITDNGNYLCRDEYSITYPNSSTTKNIKIKSGGKITINLSNKNQINNLHNITVEHKEECINKDNNPNTTMSFLSNQESKIGNIKLKYESNDKYSGEFELEKKLEKPSISKGDSVTIQNTGRTTNKGNQINNSQWNRNLYKKVTKTEKATYNLNENTYKCTHPTTGDSINKSSSCTNGYQDNINPGLPIAFNNSNDIKISLKYVPIGKKLSNISDNVDANGFLFNTNDDATEEGISGDSNAYVKGNAKTPNNHTCVDKLLNDEYSCTFKNTDSPSSDAKYYCDIKQDKTGAVYYGSNGTEVKEEDYKEQCCSRGCDDNQPCCPGSTIENPICPEKDKETNKYYCPTTKCKPSTANSCKPPKGKAIYRTIDLNDPFPGQNGLGRLTGTNWCSQNMGTGEITCDNNPNNYFVKKYILNNRGIEGKKVYTKQPLYTFNLDSNTIQNIREYNNNHKYSDFTLTKQPEDTFYTSTFARNPKYGYDDNNSKCNQTKNLNTCANN